MASEVDHFFKDAKNWSKELNALRKILKNTELLEELKWKQACYTYQGKNILILGGLKDACILSFFKGVLLKDNHNLLDIPGKNTQSARYIKFKDTKQIESAKDILLAYIQEAISIEEKGLKVDFKSNDALEIPEELKLIFDENPNFKIAFKKLTAGRQKGYLLHFSQAKQSKTRTSRIEKNIQRIQDGYGFYDCTCGLSKRMPNCDGSHKSIGK